MAARLAELLGRRVRAGRRDWLDGVDVAAGEVVLCENVRFNAGEKQDDEALARRMAALCDVFVMDAFGTAHRAQASTHGVARFAPVACAGPLLAAELDALGKALDEPARPLVAIVGGSKVSTKLAVLESAARQGRSADRRRRHRQHVHRRGRPAGRQVAVRAGPGRRGAPAAGAGRDRSVGLPVPADVVVATELSAHAHGDGQGRRRGRRRRHDPRHRPEQRERVAGIVASAGTIVWNGPVGVFEFDQFGEGTRALARAIAASRGVLDRRRRRHAGRDRQVRRRADISYISTGGGAFLEFLEGKTLPAVAVLEQRAAA